MSNPKILTLSDKDRSKYLAESAHSRDPKDVYSASSVARNTVLTAGRISTAQGAWRVLAMGWKSFRAVQDHIRKKVAHQSAEAQAFGLLSNAQLVLIKIENNMEFYHCVRRDASFAPSGSSGWNAMRRDDPGSIRLQDPDHPAVAFTLVEGNPHPIYIYEIGKRQWTTVPWADINRMKASGGEVPRYLALANLMLVITEDHELKTRAPPMEGHIDKLACVAPYPLTVADVHALATPSEKAITHLLGSWEPSASSLSTENGELPFFTLADSSGRMFAAVMSGSASAAIASPIDRDMKSSNTYGTPLWPLRPFHGGSSLACLAMACMVELAADVQHWLVLFGQKQTDDICMAPPGHSKLHKATHYELGLLLWQLEYSLEQVLYDCARTANQPPNSATWVADVHTLDPQQHAHFRRALNRGDPWLTTCLAQSGAARSLWDRIGAIKHHLATAPFWASRTAHTRHNELVSQPHRMDATQLHQRLSSATAVEDYATVAWLRQHGALVPDRMQLKQFCDSMHLSNAWTKIHNHNFVATGPISRLLVVPPTSEGVYELKDARPLIHVLGYFALAAISGPPPIDLALSLGGHDIEANINIVGKYRGSSALSGTEYVYEAYSLAD